MRSQSAQQNNEEEKMEPDKWITLTDKDGERTDLLATRIVRVDELQNKSAAAIVYLDTPENGVVWVKETVEEVRAKL